MLIENCDKCHGEVEYLSDIHIIPKTDPPEAGFEGICVSCGTRYYHKFKQYDTEITEEDY